jgi:putative copper export protein
MRDRGWNPALAQYSVAGTHSSYWNTNKATVASFLSGAIAQLTQPNIRAMVWYQGEHDAIDGPGTTWQTNVAATVLAIRTAVSKPTLPLVVVKIPSNYQYVMPYLTATRASQDAFVAADGHATMVETPSPTYIDSLHLTQASIDVTARLIINAII